MCAVGARIFVMGVHEVSVATGSEEDLILLDVLFELVGCFFEYCFL